MCFVFQRVHANFAGQARALHASGPENILSLLSNVKN